MSVGGRPTSDSFVISGVRVAARSMLMLPIALSVAFYFALGIAEAHGGGPGLGYDPCMGQVGADDFIHLAVYQPEFNPFAEYCGALPKAGRTLLVFDLMGGDLPDARVSLDVFDEGGRFHLSVPARLYRSGVADLRADLPPGRYTVLVGIDQPEGRHRLAFPLAVGAWWERLVVPLVIVLLIGSVTAGYCVFQIRGIASEYRNSPTKNPIELRRVWKS
jgi:hypothetical protein